jgi:ATPase subunit of ABC transporter with duplicated ATPase domains
MSAHVGVTLAAIDISKSHGSTPVLVDVSMTARPRARIGVVGANGIGKSTLLRILAGLEPADSGSVVRTPDSLTVGYLPQEPATGASSACPRSGPGEGVLWGNREVPPTGVPGTVREYLVRRGGTEEEWRLVSALREAGLGGELDRPLAALSGGEAARVALASILLTRFDVLLLDEPTNDLDFAGLELLERFVEDADAAIVVVSHDRAFLERTVDRVVELEEGSREAREYAGGFAEYERLRGLERERKSAAHGRYTERRRELEGALRRRQGQARASGKAANRRLTRALSQRTRSVERRLETLEPADKPWEPWDLRLDLAPSARGGDVLVRLEEAVVERGSFRLGPLDLTLGFGERVAITGPNGSGKSTLLAAVLGRLPLAAGVRRVGPSTVVGELEQTRDAFGTATLLDAFVARSLQAPEEARTLLAKFGLGADDVLRPAASLSPGERTRAGLALVAARGVNLLVLDEPTNHLDLPAIEELERALADYEGALLVVSHDRRFLETVAPTRAVELS